MDARPIPVFPEVGFGDTVFYASCGVKILQFYENGCFQVLFFLDVYNFHQGSVSYQTNASFINLRHLKFLLILKSWRSFFTRLFFFGP